MSKEETEKNPIRKIDVEDLSKNQAETIDVINDKEGKLIRHTESTGKKQIPIDNIKKK